MMSMCMQYSPIPDRLYLHISIRVVYNYCNSLVIIELIHLTPPRLCVERYLEPVCLLFTNGYINTCIDACVFTSVITNGNTSSIVYLQV